MSTKKLTLEVVSRSLDITNIDPEVRFCTLRCAGRYGTDTARAWERRGIPLKHAAQREAELAAQVKESSTAAAHAAVATAPTEGSAS